MRRPRAIEDDDKRMNPRQRAEQEATRAASLPYSVMEPLSESDSLLVLNLIENPPAANAKLRAAIAALPKPKRA